MTRIPGVLPGIELGPDHWEGLLGPRPAVVAVDEETVQLIRRYQDRIKLHPLYMRGFDERGFLVLATTIWGRLVKHGDEAIAALPVQVPPDALLAMSTGGIHHFEFRPAPGEPKWPDTPIGTRYRWNRGPNLYPWLFVPFTALLLLSFC